MITKSIKNIIIKYQILSHTLLYLRIKKYRLRQFIYVQIYKRNILKLPHLGVGSQETVMIFVMKHVTGGTNSATKTLIENNPLKCYFIMRSHKELVDVEVCYEGRSETAGTHIDPVYAINSIVKARRINKIIIQQLIDFNLSKIVNALETINIPIEVYLHDFFLICPTVFLLNEKNRFCNLPDDIKECKKCISLQLAVKSRNIKTKNVRNFHDIVTWRQNSAKLFKASSKVIVSSMITENIYKRAFSEISGKVVYSYELLKCSENFRKLDSTYNPFANKTIKIAMVGSWIYEKGKDIFEKMQNVIDANNLKETVSLSFIGYADPKYFDKRIEYLGKYNSETLSEIIMENNVSICLIPSVVCETFCIAAQDCIEVGIPLIVLGIGAMKERVTNNQKCHIVAQLTEDTIQYLTDIEMADIILHETIEFANKSRKNI